MTSFIHLVWAPEDEGAGKKSPFAGEGTLGPTMDSRLGEALPEMGPGDAADTGGMAVDPTVIGPSYAGGFRDVGAGERAMSSDVPAGGQSDTFFDDEAERQYEREQSMPPGGNLGGDIDHWRP
ncbi:hypothetical protein D3C72_446740 [compost metagenome]